MLDVLGNPLASGSLAVTETYSIPLLINPYHNLLPVQSVLSDSFCNGCELRGGRPSPTWTVSRIQASQLELQVPNQNIVNAKELALISWHWRCGTIKIYLHRKPEITPNEPDFNFDLLPLRRY
jgi:hypothetical protein